jgi:hypothetical protein
MSGFPRALLLRHLNQLLSMSHLTLRYCLKRPF